MYLSLFDGSLTENNQRPPNADIVYAQIEKGQIPLLFSNFELKLEFKTKFETRVGFLANLHSSK